MVAHSQAFLARRGGGKSPAAAAATGVQGRIDAVSAMALGGSRGSEEGSGCCKADKVHGGASHATQEVRITQIASNDAACGRLASLGSRSGRSWQHLLILRQHSRIPCTLAGAPAERWPNASSRVSAGPCAAWRASSRARVRTHCTLAPKLPPEDQRARAATPDDDASDSEGASMITASAHPVAAFAPRQHRRTRPSRFTRPQQWSIRAADKQSSSGVNESV